MKKIVSIIIVICLFSLANGQTIFTETFDEVSIPEAWTISEAENNWSCEKSIRAFGTPNELRLKPEPAFSGISRIISPVIDLSTYNEVVIRFNYYIDHFNESYTFGIATTSNGGEYNTIWQLSPSQPVFSSDEFVIINNDDVGSDNFQFCFFFEGNTQDIYNLFIDDIEIYSLLNEDVELSKLVMSKYCLTGTYPIKARVTNLGMEEIDFLTLNYQLDNGLIKQLYLNNLNLSFGESHLFSTSDDFIFTPGQRVIDFWITDVNLLGPDDNLENDSKSKTINVASEGVQRLLLFEEFASSTCVPCSNFNSILFHPLLENNQGKYTLINYPMNFPDPGDPYNISYCNDRMDFYGIGNIPYLQTEGILSGLVSQNYFDNQYALPALVEIIPEYSISGTEINVNVDVYPYVDISDANLFICVTEKKTSGNIMDNGETEFYNVLMDMLPTSEGISFECEAGNTVSLSETKDLASSFIEEFDDLEIVVFIQDNETKKILQSSIASIITDTESNIENENSYKVYPNPFLNYLVIEFDLDEPSDIEVNILDIQGVIVKNVVKGNYLSGNYSVKWNGKDNRYKEVEKGFYLLEFRKNGKASYKKIVK